MIDDTKVASLLGAVSGLLGFIQGKYEQSGEDFEFVWPYTRRLDQAVKALVKENPSEEG